LEQKIKISFPGFLQTLERKVFVFPNPGSIIKIFDIIAKFEAAKLISQFSTI